MRNKWPSGYSRFEVLAREIDIIYYGKEDKEDYYDFGNKYVKALSHDMFPKYQAISAKAEVLPGASMVPQFSVTGNAEFSAATTLTPQGTPRYTVSNGLLLALDDLFLMLCCDQGFFGTEYKSNKTNVAQFHMAVPSQFGYLLPKKRYQNYFTFEDISFYNELKGRGIEPLPSGLSNFFKSIPISSDDRIHLAAMMTDIAFMWILLHEESHFILGHSHFLLHAHGINHLHETNIQIGKSFPKKIRRFIEYDADKRAAKILTEVFYKHKLLAFGLEPHAQNPAWGLRLLMTALGCTTILFERTIGNNKFLEDYPKPRTRLLTTLIECSNWAREHKTGKGLTENDIDDAILGSLNDIWIASLAISKEDDAMMRYVDAQPGLIPRLYVDQPLGIIRNRDEIMDLFMAVFLNDSSYDPTGTLSTEWLEEMDEIKRDTSVFKDVIGIYENLAREDLKKSIATVFFPGRPALYV